MDYSAEQLKKITTLGTLGYGLQKCINVLDLEDEEQFTLDFADRSSRVYRAYKKGQDIADFAIDSKLFEKARDGDIEALHELNERKAQRALEEEDEFFEENG